MYRLAIVANHKLYQYVEGLCGKMANLPVNLVGTAQELLRDSYRHYHCNEIVNVCVCVMTTEICSFPRAHSFK